MPMGVVTDEDFERELANSSKKPINNTPSQIEEAEIVEMEQRGRKPGDNNVPSSLRSLIGATAAVEGREAALSLARDFGISASSVSAYSKGATSTKSYHEPKKEIQDVINLRKKHASKKALLRLHNTLDRITPDKLDSLDASDLSVIAKNMAAVVKVMEPDNHGASAPLVQFQLFAPPQREEASFDVIQVND